MVGQCVLDGFQNKAINAVQEHKPKNLVRFTAFTDILHVNGGL